LVEWAFDDQRSSIAILRGMAIRRLRILYGYWRTFGELVQIILRFLQWLRFLRTSIIRLHPSSRCILSS